MWFLNFFPRRIKVSFPSDVRKTALPDTPLLNAGQEIALPMEIVLAGAGLFVFSRSF